MTTRYEIEGGPVLWHIYAYEGDKRVASFHGSTVPPFEQAKLHQRMELDSTADQWAVRHAFDITQMREEHLTPCICCGHPKKTFHPVSSYDQTGALNSERIIRSPLLRPTWTPLDFEKRKLGLRAKLVLTTGIPL